MRAAPWRMASAAEGTIIEFISICGICCHIFDYWVFTFFNKEHMFSVNRDKNGRGSPCFDGAMFTITYIPLSYCICLLLSDRHL